MLFRERHLQFVWGLRLFRGEGLRTEDARVLTIQSPGVPNRESGPDFRGARGILEGRPIWGDVELHLTTDGWWRHRHGDAGAYDSVILHVALDRGGRPGPGGIPELVLSPYLEKSRADLVRDLAALIPPPPRGDAGSFRALGDRRFERRVDRLRILLRVERLEEVFYREVLIGLGYKSNKAGFEELARLVPLRSVRGFSREEIEGRLLRAARGIRWRRKGVRPANRPERRIQGIARWLAAVGTEAPHRAHFSAPLRSFDPAGTGEIGRDRSSALVANTVLPLAAAAGVAEEAERARRVFHSLPAGSPNRKVRDAMGLLGTGRPASLREEWGLMETLRLHG